MHASRFDIAIVGDSLAARMTAAVLAKHGKRLLQLSAPVCRDSWHFSSLFVDRILASLGAHNSLTPGQPFQVLTSRARVTITPGRPIASELNREFGAAAPAIIGLLAGLERLGSDLETVLFAHGGLPAGTLAGTACWRWLCLRRKVPITKLTMPLAEYLRPCPEPAAEWLNALFQGLSLRPLDRLTVADGALLWAQACRPEGLVDEDLRQLLQKRFEQFHGVEVALDTLRSVEHSGGSWVFSLHGGGRFHAGQLIVGDLGQELPGHGVARPRQCLAPARHFKTSALDGQLSPLLAERVIASGPLPMRLMVSPTPEGLTGQFGTIAPADEACVRQQFEPYLPFARFDLAGQPHCRGNSLASEATPKALPLFKLPIQTGSHLWCADETRLLPQLGNGGAALLAWTLVQRIDPTAV